MKTYIYRLLDPRDMAVKYIGKTININRRRKDHNMANGKFRVGRWLRCLKAIGLKPIFEVIETVDGSGWELRERYWINYYQEQGAELCNLSSGGEGEVGRKLNPEVVERMRQMFLGRPIPPEQRAKISESLTGKVQSPETVAKRLAVINERRAVQGKPLLNLGEASVQHEKEQAAEYKQRVRIKEGKPKKFSPEWKAKIADSLKARFESLPPEEQQRIKQQGKKGGGYWTGKKRPSWTPEQRAKLSAIHKERLSKLTPEQKEARMAAARAAQKLWVPPTFEVTTAC